MKYLFGILIAACCFALAVSAHDGLHEQILAVTEQIKKEPRNAALYLKRAELYRLHEEWKNSENDFNRAERIDAKLTSVNLGRGKLWLDSKQFGKAKVALEKYLAAEPNSFEGIITMARVCAKLRLTDAAVRHFSEAIRLAPADSAEIYLERAATLAAANRLTEALRGLDEGLEKLTAAAERKETFLLKRGEILLRAKRPCEARNSLLEARAGFESSSSFRRNVRAVREQIARLEKLLGTIPAKNCP